jgi:hypothetical protein
LAQPWLVTASEGKRNVDRNSEPTTVFGGILLQVWTAIVVKCFRAAITVEQIILVIAVTETLSHMVAPSSLLTAVATAVLRYVVWVRFIFRLEQSVLIAGLPLKVLSCFLFLEVFPFSSHFRADRAVRYDEADEQIALNVAGGKELLS